MKVLVCNNFNRLLRESSLSKRAIAKAIGVNENTLQRWKNGDSYPELPNIEKLAKVLNVSPLEFYKAEVSVVKPIPVSEMVKKVLTVPDEVYDLAQDLQGDLEAWETIVATMKGLIKIKHNHANQNNSKQA